MTTLLDIIWVAYPIGLVKVFHPRWIQALINSELRRQGKI